MEFQRALRFPTQDPDWLKKVLIGLLISFVPILNFAGLGYGLDVLRNVAQGRETPLPEWNDIGTYFIRGLMGIVVSLIYSLPLLVLLCPFVAITAATSNGNEASTGAAIALLCLNVIIFLVSLAVLPFQIAAISRFAVTNQLNEALPGPVIALVRSNFRPWLTAIVYGIGLSLIIGLLVACTFFIGLIVLIPMAFYLQLITYHWYGQAYREATGGNTYGAPRMV